MKITLHSRKLFESDNSIIQAGCPESRALWTLMQEAKTNKDSPHLLPILHQAGHRAQNQKEAFEFIEKLLELKEITIHRLPDLANLGFEIDFTDNSETKELHDDLERHHILHKFSIKNGKLNIC